jgi:ketosteroid isomerase-like protein
MDLDAVEELFAADAVYRRSPYDDPIVGIDAIKTFWAEDDPEEFAKTAAPVAVEGRAAVVQAEVRTASRYARSTRPLVARLR